MTESTVTTAPGIRVSVVVAVYNTGEYLEPLVESLLGQTMPADQWEAIFVDDGSTDETPARLDRLAAEHDNITVLHEPNSGWPGRPRNVGTDLARGTYVFYADHDDWFGREALVRLADYGDANGADIVIGRYAGHRRGVARAMFDRNRPAATLVNTPLMDSLTPHKLFRRAFLVEQDLRFPEGKRRLEDHVFVAEAYFRARTISVLSDYHCYFHIGRPDAGNAGYQRIDPASYYGYVREAIEVVERHTEAGPERNRLLRRPLRQEVLARLDGGGFLEQDPDYQRALFDAARDLTLEAIPEDVDLAMTPPQRIRAALLRAGDFDGLVAYVRHQVTLRAAATLTGLRWVNGSLVIDVSAELRDRVTGARLRYETDGADVRVTVPAELSVVVPRAARKCSRDVLRGTVQVVVRRRADSEEWPLPIETTRAVIEGDGGVEATYRARARLDPLTLGGGQMLTRGIWDLFVKINQTGWAKEVRLGAVRAPAVDAERRPALLGGVPMVPYWTSPGDNLSFSVHARATTLAANLSPTCSLVGDGDARAGSRPDLRIDLHLATAAAEPVSTVVRLDAGDGRTVEIAPLLVQRAGEDAAAVTVPLDPAGDGTWQVLLGVGGDPAPIGYAVRIADGTASLLDASGREVAADASAPPAVPSGPVRPRRAGLPVPDSLRAVVAPKVGASTRRAFRRLERAYVQRRAKPAPEESGTE